MPFKPSGRRGGSSIQGEKLALNASAIQQQVVITHLHYDIVSRERRRV
ncbi:MAG: hypothetical protein H0W99_01495 [Acidobacteria bacterium]|nr:hypothetical protein [Acidobacteriota bacterium]